MKNPVHITILGQNYAIKSDGEAEEVRRVAAFVNEQIDSVMAGRKAVDTMNAAVLALLNIGADYLRLQQKCQSEDDLTDRLERMLERLNDLPDTPHGASSNDLCKET